MLLPKTHIGAGVIGQRVGPDYVGCGDRLFAFAQDACVVGRSRVALGALPLAEGDSFLQRERGYEALSSHQNTRIPTSIIQTHKNRFVLIGTHYCFFCRRLFLS